MMCLEAKEPPALTKSWGEVERLPPSPRDFRRSVAG